MEGADLNWRKSSYSGNGGGECVEIGASPGAVVVRDTTDRTGPVLRFTPAAWRRFADRVKRSLASRAQARACRGCSRGWEWALRGSGLPRQVRAVATSGRDRANCTRRGPRRGVGLGCMTR